MLYDDITDIIVKSAFEVHRLLGPGFLEKVYENALGYEFSLQKLNYTTQKSIDVYYKDITAGQYFADIIVDDKVIIEIKAIMALAPEHTAQLLNYLKGTGYKLGMLINFGGSKVEIKRVIN